MIEADTLLVGGPFDGCVVEAGGGMPTILLSKPRAATLLDVGLREAEWHEELEWYVMRP